MRRGRERGQKAGRTARDYLECAGVVPIIQGSTYRKYCASLEYQYCSLDAEVRQRARVEGRKLIRRQGIEATAIRLIPIAAPVCDLSNLTSDQRRRVRAEYRRKIRWNSLNAALSKVPDRDAEAFVAFSRTGR